MKRWLLWTLYRFRLRYYATLNYHAGYMRSPIRRCRECGHTTPYHKVGCSKRRRVDW